MRTLACGAKAGNLGTNMKPISWAARRKLFAAAALSIAAQRAVSLPVAQCLVGKEVKGCDINLY